jgi:hypothetical protein
VAEAVARRRAAASRRATAGGVAGPFSNRRTLWLIVGGVFVAVLALGGLLYWLLSSPGPTKDGPPRQGRQPLRVNPAEGKTLAAAVIHARKGDTIQLQGDIAEHSIRITGPDDLTIEPEPGKKVVWKMPPLAGRPGNEKKEPLKLLSVTAGNFRLKGLTLDGDGRADVLIEFYGKCPGTRLEDLELRGARRCSILCGNCEGTKEAPLRLLNLRFDTPAGATALYFKYFEHTPSIPENRFVVVRGCAWAGPGGKVRASNLKYVDQSTLELPRGVQLEVAREKP